jgi:nicotinamidase-related amidase
LAKPDYPIFAILIDCGVVLSQKTFFPDDAPASKGQVSETQLTGWHMSFERITTANTLVMLVDHQTMTIDWVKSIPKATTIASCRVLARLARDYEMPLVLTTTMEDYVGPTIPEIREVAGDAFERRFKRGGELSCWDAADLRDGVKRLACQNVVLAGLTTDICLFWAAVDGKKLGYNVTVVADACGTMSSMGDSLTFDRLRGLGITVTVVNQVVTELVPNFGTPQGQKAQKIMADEIISKLGNP